MTEIARKSHSLILRRLASVGQKNAGEAIGKSETWVSRWKDADAEIEARLLAALGLKIVPATAICYSPEGIEHLMFFARKGMAQQPAALEWEDDE